MRILRIAAGWVLAALIVSGIGLRVSAQVAGAGSSPVLVELFTSEGCSSCPPADDLLAQIGRQTPNVIVLSEHVTYWNKGGWHDPFSLDESTARQADYVQHLGLDTTYTPQMVVGGRYELLGSDARAAAQAIARASSEPRVPVGIGDLTVGADGRVSFAVQTGAVKSGSELFAVVAQDEGSKHVSNGENGGHTLRHVQIARSFLQAAKIRNGESYSGRLTVALPEPIAGSGWHLVVFLERGRGGPILGAASMAIPGGTAPSISRGE